MSEVALDFGTSNTVLARHNETLGRSETVEIPGISSRMTYRLTPEGEEHVRWVIPSLIHYAEKETLIGDQVLSRGLAEHPYTMRWMKRSIAAGISKVRKTAQGFKSPAEAGREFLATVLRYASDQISLDQDSFTFTAPVEAFETFQDWLWRVAETEGIRRMRVRDEPTACVFGYQGAARQQDRFVVFDFGGGTLDVSCVRLDLASTAEKKAIQLGQAGCDLGGMNIDLWLAEDFCRRHELEDFERRELEALILRQAEAVKIALSDPMEAEAEMQLTSDLGRAPKLLTTAYTRSCAECERGRPGKHTPARQGCLGCILLEHDFLKSVRETLTRAMENAAVKAGMRRSDVTRVLVTGGTSLIPVVRRHLESEFGGLIEYDHPFDSVARGACRGIVFPVLQHDYAIESFNPERKQYEFKPLFRIGTEYPTPRADAVRKWIGGNHSGQTRIGLKIFEVSQVKRRNLEVSIVDAQGALCDTSKVATDCQYVCLNPENPTFIPVDPPFDKERDRRRFAASFSVDGNRRLLVTATDHLTGKDVLRDHPVVRL